MRLPEVTGIPEMGWFAILIAIAGAVFWFLEKRFGKTPGAGMGDKQGELL